MELLQEEMVVAAMAAEAALQTQLLELQILAVVVAVVMLLAVRLVVLEKQSFATLAHSVVQAEQYQA
jgi:hypothetical protein